MCNKSDKLAYEIYGEKSKLIGCIPLRVKYPHDSITTVFFFLLKAIYLPYASAINYNFIKCK